MKKFWERLKETLCGILPLLFLIGIPLALSVVVWVIFNWNDIPEILRRIADMGDGSYIRGILLVVFCTIGSFNIGIGILMTIDKMSKTFHKRFTLWMTLYLILTALGILALKEIMI